jgi:integrin alpha 8
VIFASEINSNLRTFGWSISAGMDLDNNEYPDLLIGAYESNNAVYLKSAPVVHLDSEVQFQVASKQVDLNTKNCRLKDGTNVPCVDVEVTLKYDGVGVPDSIGILTL